MLQSRNLDDQTFDEIMEHVLGKLPWVCPAWTDYNAHDPGITILELLAWYKEMQQYHLNTVTPAMKRRLLKLVGVALRPPHEAQCFIELEDVRAKYPEGARLESDGGVPFELDRAIDCGARFAGAFLVAANGATEDITAMLCQPRISIRAFGQANERAELLIGFDAVEGQRLSLWFEIDDAYEVKRNPFPGAEQRPREIAWTFVGAGAIAPRRDDTHALSKSGYVVFDIPEAWAETDGGAGLATARYLKLTLTDAGCEEDVRLRGISGSRHPVSQRETWARRAALTVGKGRQTVALTDALSMAGNVFAFARDEAGLRQVPCTNQGGEVKVNAARYALDGQENLILVSADPIHTAELFFDSTGLPGMTLELTLMGRKVLSDRLELICDTVLEDGQTRPAIWSYADDLYTAGPRDRVFTYDPVREQLVFGDGMHGMIVPGGKNAVMLSSFVLSALEEGNIPEGRLTFEDDGTLARNTAASMGAEAESIERAAHGFLLKLEEPEKCASAADYERAALSTPGLRVAKAHAIPGFDPDEPAGRSRIPVVTVVAVPYGNADRPMPDARFMGAVRMRLERMRPVCTVVKVIPPRYCPIGVSVRVRAKAADAAPLVRQAVESCLGLSSSRNIGDSLVRNDFIAAVMKQPGILAVERLELRPMGEECYNTAAGDILIPRNGVAYLAALDSFDK